MCPTLQAHFLSLVASVLQHKKQSASILEAGVLHEVRNLISRNEMSCLCCLDGKILRYPELCIFRWFCFQKMKHAIPYSPYCWITTLLFLELGVVHRPSRERYMYLAKEYSQTVSVQLESRKSTQQFTIIVMVNHITVCCVHVHSVKCL